MTPFKKELILCLLGLWLATSANAADLKQLEEELLYRTAHGSAQDIQTLLAHTKNPHLANEQGQSLLFIAAQRGDTIALSLVETLVANGADVNNGGEKRFFPLIAAIQSGNPAIVSFLLQSGADYRVVDAQGISAAEHAKQSLSPEVTQALAERIAKDNQAHALLSSPQAEFKLRYDLAYHACAYQYYKFYYQSKQDEIDELTQKATLKPHEAAIRDAMGKLGYYFKYDTDMQFAQFNAGKNAIFKELEGLISNRWRRQKGVGQPGDMEKRCEPIATKLKPKKKLNQS